MDIEAAAQAFRDPEQPTRVIHIGYEGKSTRNIRRAVSEIAKRLPSLTEPVEHNGRVVSWPGSIGTGCRYDQALAQAIERLQVYFKHKYPNEHVIIDGQLGSKTPIRLAQELQDRGLSELAQEMASESGFDVFLSYSRASQDQDVVASIHKALDSESISVFRDTKSIVAGHDWFRRIESAMESCRVIVLIASPNSLASKFVVMEVGWARLRDKTCIPVQLDDVRYPSVFSALLGSVQSVTYDRRDPVSSTRQIIRCVEQALRDTSSG